MHNLTDQNIFLFLLQVLLLLGIARILGEAFRLFKQPTITAEILTGVLLGPTIFGRFLPYLQQKIFPADVIQQNMLETVAWLGLLFFLMEAGLKMDFSSAWRHRGKAMIIALTDIVVPMLIAFTATWFFLPESYAINSDQRILFCLFMATVLMISAMPVAVRTLTDLNVVKTDLGFLIMSALSVNEIIGWLVFTLIFGLLTQTQLALGKVSAVFVAALGFTILCLTLGRKVADYAIGRIRQLSMPEPGASLTFVCLLGLLCGAAFQKIGINALLGFFIAGVITGEARALPERTRQVISQMVYAIFVPLFFAGIALRVDFFRHFDLSLVLFVTVIGIGGKFIGAWLGAVFAGLPKVNRLSVAIAHTPGGSMEIVLATIALNYRIISEPMFVAIIIGGVLAAIIIGPWLKFSLCRRRSISALEFFGRREIIAQLKSGQRDSAIAELCQLAAEQGNMPSADILTAAVLKRENAMGTAVEEGIALPHGRIPLLIRPMVIFGRSEQGLEWNSPDGRPSQLIFLILTPKENDDIQVQILRIIAKAMSDERIRQSLRAAESHEELWQQLQEAFTVHQVVRR